MNRIPVSHTEVDEFVKVQKSKGIDVSWDGYTLVFFRKNPNGFTDRKGAFRGGRWGILTRVDCDSNGIWNVPVKSVAIR